MDEDGLILAGQDYDQVTWMDVRVGDILPTPRHGKPVEINAYWYNALRIMGEFRKFFPEDEKDYEGMAERVMESFEEKFWNQEAGCLKDVVSGTRAEELMSEMEGIEVDMTQNWNRRYRENMVRLKSGDLLEGGPGHQRADSPDQKRGAVHW